MRADAATESQFFRDVRPVNTIGQAARFIDRDRLVETEVDAVI